MVMEGTGWEQENPDEARIRPVSSLLSHFEKLSHNQPKPCNAFGTSPRDSSTRFLRTPEPGDEPRSSRASLDLPRPTSPWNTTDEESRTFNHARNTGDSQRTRESPRSRYGRPISMSIHHSSPQLPPTLTVQSPKSPPRKIEALRRTPPKEDHRISRSSIFVPRESVSAGVSPRPNPRPVTPQHGSSGEALGLGRLSPGMPLANGRTSPADHRKSKSTSLPPPANRAEKPKIPAKPAAFSHPDSSTLALKQEHASDYHISPFSTPPSSPEKPPSKPVSTGKLPPKPPGRPITEPPPRRSFDERPPAPVPAPAASIRTTDARDLGFSRSRPEPPRPTRPLQVQIPTSSGLSDPPPIPHSAHPSRALDSPLARPGLPPRSASTAKRQRWPSPGRDASQPARIQGHLTPVARSEPAVPVLNKETKPPRQPVRQQSLSRDSSLPSQSERRIVRTDTEEEELVVDEGPVSRTDYPDASQANRRPPLFKTGPREISTRYDTRLFAVCGKYVCTAGYLTRVWDLTTGEQVMSLSHGETVKSLSLAFKPGSGLEDEGQKIWLGTSAGELLEVDILSGSVVTSRSYPSRREVIQILRHRKEMWTLDDEGRLLVWPPDESGSPNLQYSYHSPPERVARGHTFSMVVDDTLWLATGKDVFIYRPNAREDSAFKIFKKPLGQQHTGEVTSGTYTTQQGGRVYLGHADGKVTTYSSTDYSCLAVVNVSVYKINCLGMVGDYLWAAYKTGMIYVYDVKTNPWIVKKDWRAHDSPVCGFILDTSSVWTMNRLQVTSLGTDNCVRLWDGMLEDDWMENRMQSRDVEFCNFREIRIAIVTWNAGASTPGSVRTSDFIRDAVHPEDPPDIIVFGFQELVDLENKKLTAKSLLLGSKKKDNGEKEHMSRQYRVWIEHLTRSLHECMPLEESYVLLHTSNMVGLFTCVFVKHKERHNISKINASEVKRGMGGLHGNKGALILRFVLDDSSLCFVNCHLAAGQTQTAHRNNDIAAILEAETLPPESSLVTRTDHFSSGGDGSMIMDHEICILNGDFNYRIDAMPRNVIIDAVRQNNLTKLLERDQLLASRRKNPGFRLRSFVEAPITFAPTYKYDVGTDQYDTSEKKRSPAWCDRILYRGLGRVKQLEYRRHEVRASDHRPVSAAFKVRVKTVLPQQRTVAWEACLQDFQNEKRRLASEASIEYLITVLGTDPRQARSLILGKAT
ncbi:Uncharacterized protein PECH_006146 [Penicillium ucsense]|uniref:Inositol polyphosphate-related phosphatase domain-containing protein n=1 Tax=Penicillium ucsense TaxID=2839758 RepID=A0A8J8W046_9EURO|nr:Uncharacterized protein PECM_008958 [Penicillium ucsense]KAF7735793.1 Uncharacterized protein PECH_006146 [Penicillium ucsense]